MIVIYLTLKIQFICIFLFSSLVSWAVNVHNSSGFAVANDEELTRDKVVLVAGKGLLKDIIDIAKTSAKVLITSDIVDLSSSNLPSNICKVDEIKRLKRLADDRVKP